MNVGNYDIVGRADTLTFTGNAAAGGPHGIRIVTVPPSAFADNTVHSQQFGIALNFGPCNDQPIVLKDLTVWRTWDYGVWGHTHGCERMSLVNVTIADAKVGMTWGAVGPSSTAHIIGDQKIYVNNSLFLGKSDGNAECGGEWETRLASPSTVLAFSWPATHPQTAIQLPIFTTVNVDWPG